MPVRLDEAEGLTEWLARGAGGLLAAVPAAAGRVVAVLAAAVLAAAVLAAAVLAAAVLAPGARAGAMGRDGAAEDAGAFAGVFSLRDAAGLNVATESIAPATRHTARMLASSGITVPRAANGPDGLRGPTSRFSRFLRRFARSSR